MRNRKVMGILGMALAVLQHDQNYIDITEPPLGLVNDTKYIGEDFTGRRHKKISKNVASRIVKKSIPREGPKIGRNDKCKCGSGQKYKKCCLAKDKNKNKML